MLTFNGFTARAQNALNVAFRETEQMGHPCVGTEHLILGLLDPISGVTKDVLNWHGIQFDAYREHICLAFGKSIIKELDKENMTSHAKKVLELACTKAKMDKRKAAGPEHLLFVLLQNNRSLGVAYLSEFGVNPYKLKADLAKHIKNPPKEDETEYNYVLQKTKKPTPNLDKYGVDLTDKAHRNRLDPIIGRDCEINRVIRILSRRSKNNPCLIGEPGVGKTAIAEGIAQKIADGSVPERLLNKRIISIDLTNMVAGTKYRGEFEERVQRILEEVLWADVILFIDEIHSIMDAGNCEGGIPVGDILKPKMARGEIQIIGATTTSEYRRYIEQDGALERRFQPVMIDSPDESTAMEMLRKIKPCYEQYHKVIISDNALETAVTLSVRYIQDRQLPDKAIDLIDEGAAMVKARTTSHQEAIVSSEDIKELVSEMTGIAVTKLTQDTCNTLMHLEGLLHERVVGQNEAVSAIARAIRRNKAGLSDEKRPVGSFLFLGPTGVGKTELCQALADILFGDKEALIKLDMSEYAERHSVSKLIGSPPGYIGYGEGGKLTEEVRRKPYAVVLLDEIEKAHPDIWNLLLQMLEDGILTDSEGRKVSFANTVVVMTSNVGADNFAEQRSCGFQQANQFFEGQKLRDQALRDLQNVFRPEIINRIDEIVVFERLHKEHIREIAGNLLGQVANRVKGAGIYLSFTTAAVRHIAEIGYDKRYGARPLRRCIQRCVEDTLADLFISGKVVKGDTLVCDFKKDLVIDKQQCCAV